MIGRLIQKLISFFYLPAESSTDELECQMDVDAMARSLQLEKQARHAAEHGMPSGDSTRPDGVERKIEGLILQRMLEVTNRANRILAGYNSTLNDLEHQAGFQRIRQLTDTAHARLDNLLADSKQELDEIKAEIRRNEQLLQQFQIRHRRTLEAEYPASRLYHFSLVLVMLLLEALANGYFFARGSDLGMLGGLSQSLAVAVLNIIPSFFLAGSFLLRYTHHVSVPVRLLASAALIGYLCWVAGFNLCVAHYRDLLVYHDSEAVRMVLDRLAAEPFSLADLNSWLLFLLGVSFSVAAMVDGYKSDDPYPGYGRLQRLNDECRDDFSHTCERMTAKATEIRDRFMRELDELCENVASAFSYQLHLLELKLLLMHKHRDCMDVLAKAGDTLVHQYRSANAMYRTTPVPDYFAESWTPEKRFELVGVDSDPLKTEQQKQQQAGLKEVQKNVRKEIEQACAQCLVHARTLQPAAGSGSEPGELYS